MTNTQSLVMGNTSWRFAILSTTLCKGYVKKLLNQDNSRFYRLVLILEILHNHLSF